MGTRRSSAEQLAELEMKMADLEARKAELETKQRQLAYRAEAIAARQKERQPRDDDRRRLLLGSILLADLATNASVAVYVRSRLPSFMQPGDLRLFADVLQGDAS